MSTDDRDGPIRGRSTRRLILAGGLASGALGLVACLPTKPSRIGFITKAKDDPYFVSAIQGAREAAAELRITVECESPAEETGVGQAAVVARLMKAGVGAITICPFEDKALAAALVRARKQGIAVSTWDSDIDPAAREVCLYPTYPRAIAQAIVDVMTRGAGFAGNFLMVTGSTGNTKAWAAATRAILTDKHPEMVIRETLVGERNLDKCAALIEAYLRAHPDTRGVFAVDDVAEAGAAKAVETLKIPAERMTIAGVGLPNAIRDYVKRGTIKEAVLWSPIDMGYAAVHVARAQLNGPLDAKRGAVKAGRLGLVRFVDRDLLLLGSPMIFTAANIDRFNF